MAGADRAAKRSWWSRWWKRLAIIVGVLILLFIGVGGRLAVHREQQVLRHRLSRDGPIQRHVAGLKAQQGQLRHLSHRPRARQLPGRQGVGLTRGVGPRHRPGQGAHRGHRPRPQGGICQAFPAVTPGDGSADHAHPVSADQDHLPVTPRLFTRRQQCVDCHRSRGAHRGAQVRAQYPAAARWLPASSATPTGPRTAATATPRRTRIGDSVAGVPRPPRAFAGGRNSLHAPWQPAGRHAPPPSCASRCLTSLVPASSRPAASSAMATSTTGSRTAPAATYLAHFIPANFSHPQEGPHIPAGDEPLQCNQCHLTGIGQPATCPCHGGKPPTGGD